MPTKPKTNQPETPSSVQGRDLFQTPRYATELLIPFIPEHINYIWECANGQGAISNVLIEQRKYSLYRSDLLNGSEYNFLEMVFPFWDMDNSAIITNPPFSLKRKFYERCRYYRVPFALLIPADYNGWIINSIRYGGCEKIIPTRRIDYITPTGKSGKTGNTSYYHSMWLTWGFGLGRTETFVELTNKMKENI